MQPMILVVMGVSGCGKSTVGRLLAVSCGVEYLEGDDLHDPENIARMHAGVPLTDAQRQGWLLRIAERLAQAGSQSTGLVVACSALKRAYRDVLRTGAPGLQLVYLHGDRALLKQRASQRSGHFMPASMLESQLATLEPPGADENAISVDVAPSPEAIAQTALKALSALKHHSGAPIDGESASSAVFTRTVLFTDTDGRARFREEAVALDQGTSESRLSALCASGGYQLRQSPVGFRSPFHCTGTPQWVFILSGEMEIGLQGGASRLFHAGEHFYSADQLPQGAVFDTLIHGHWSRQCGSQPLVTLFVRD